MELLGTFWQRIASHLATDRQTSTPGPRSCRFEQMEPRRLLAADLHLGAVYFEEATGDDTEADVIEVTYEGGVAGTQLTRLVIDGDKKGNGRHEGDIFFDTAAGGLGAFEHVGLTIESSDGFDVKSVAVADGGSQIAFTFIGFDPGEKLVFSIDVDEIGFIDDEAGTIDTTSVVEGGEFQRTRMTAEFTAPHYALASLETVFWDSFDANFAAAAATAGSTLDLPGDPYIAEDNLSDRTAGAVVHDAQTPLPIAISGTVFVDQDLNNVQSPGENGIAGVAVGLWVFDAAADTYLDTGRVATTDGVGDYRFDSDAGAILPGRYEIRETQPTGFFSVGASAGTVDGAAVGVVLDADTISRVEVVGGQDSIDNDFAEALPAVISGRVHASTDGDCVFDPEDIPLANVQIDLLDTQGNLVATTFTDEDGRYTFDNIAPGEYQIFEHQPAGYFDGDEHVGTAGGTSDGDDTISGIRLTSGAVAVDYDFCEHVGVDLSGFVYHDADNNGVFDTSETGIAGAVLKLLDAAGNATGATATTDTRGFYAFRSLQPGVYGVAELQPSGYLDGLDTPGNQGGTAHNPGDRITDVVLPMAHDGENYNFGELLPGSISGRVHASTDGDCVFDPEDIPLANVQIDLLDTQGNLIATTFTDEGGQYTFDNVAPGEYQIFEHQPPGYFDGDEHVGTAGGTSDGVDTISGIRLTSGAVAVDYDFCEHVGIDLSGFVYHDADNDGVFDADELGIAGVELNLLDAQGNETGATASTDDAGFYVFHTLRPGVYGVAEVQPSDYLDGLDTPGNFGGTAHNPGDRITDVALLIARDGENYNFGELLPSSIGGRVFVDADHDWQFSPGDPVIEGVAVELVDDAGSVIATTTTESDGEYRFTDLPSGVYGVHEIQPDGYFQGDEHIGSGGGELVDTDHIGQIVILSDMHLVDYDFTEVPPASLSGFVFQDGEKLNTVDGKAPDNLHELRDGRRTEDDTPLGGVTLELRHGVTGEPIQASAALPGTYALGPIHTTTDAQGFYQFVGLPPGTYAVFEVHPAGFVDGVDTAGSLGGLAVNPSDHLNPLALSQLTVDPADDAILRIPLVANAQSTENNFSEVRIGRVPIPPEPPTPEPDPAPILAPLADVPDVLNAAVLPPAAPPVALFELFAGSSRVIAYTWHLSVIDGGQPRGARGTNDVPMRFTHSRSAASAWHAMDMQQSEWTFAVANEQNPQTRRHVIFGNADAKPVSGDFNGDGITDVGVFLDGEWFIDLNGNGQWDEGDLWAKLGRRDDLPITGDWDGDGKIDIGIFGHAWPGDPLAIHREPGLPDHQNTTSMHRNNVSPMQDQVPARARMMRLTSQGKMRTDVIDHVFHYGVAGDTPVTGDWNGDGIDTIGVFRDGFWHIDVDGDGKSTQADGAIEFGRRGDLPVVGDWNGDGVDQIGVYRAGRWLLDTNGNRQLDAQDKVFELGGADDLPVTGDWDGDGVDEPGVYHRTAGRMTVAEN